ncbi:hypothetical protein EAP58_28655 [Salmonella enterica]|nr:hypothetical protein [Salmonella enterica]HCL5065889.1 hypothetical protein [Salmonella enterica]
MTTININRKQSQGNHWQDALQDAPESDKSTSAHKVKPDSGRTPQKPTSEPEQAKQKPVQERVRPEGMTRRQWKNVKNMRRVLAKYQISKVGQIWTTDIQAFQTPFLRLG